jgi:hypothetical protein
MLVQSITHYALMLLVLGLLVGVPKGWQVLWAHLSTHRRDQILHWTWIFMKAAETAKAQGAIPDGAAAKKAVLEQVLAKLPYAVTGDVEAVIEAFVQDLHLAKAAIIGAAASTPPPAAPATTPTD